MCLIHNFGNWEDVKLGDKVEAPTGFVFPWYRQIITQQRRCSRCNLVKTRTT